MVNYNTDRSHHCQEEDLAGKMREKQSLDWMETLKILRAKLRRCKVDNETIVRA